MGILLQEPYQTETDYTINNGVYITLRGQAFITKNEEDGYYIFGYYSVYASKQTYINSKNALLSGQLISKNIEKDELDCDIIKCHLYPKLKETLNFSNYIDD